MGILGLDFETILEANFKELLGLILAIKALFLLLGLDLVRKALFSLESIGVRVVKFSVFSDFGWLGNSYCTQEGGGGLSGYNEASGSLIKPL